MIDPWKFDLISSHFQIMIKWLSNTKMGGDQNSGTKRYKDQKYKSTEMLNNKKGTFLARRDCSWE
jgi:hypothetical protein